MTAVSDNFNRANSSSLGASWTEVSGDWEIVSNKLQCNTDAGGLGYYLRYGTDVGSSDMFAQAVTTSTQTSGNSNTGVAVRMRAAANTSYQVTTRHAGDILWFWRIVGGGETKMTNQTGVDSLSVAIASGDTIRAEVVGSVIRAKVNGVVVGFCVDTNITDGQRAGVNAWNEIAADVTELDDFAGGALIADGGLVAGFVSGIGAQTARSTAANPTPTIPASVAAGQLVIAHGTIRSITETLAPPSGEGWSQLELASGNSLRTYVWAKVWGLGGQTDDTTPTFTRTGTTGAFVTCSLLTNPLHSTRPWTSVASAVAASGNQSNAAAAACTAPSVSGNWAHATVVRLFSSADDNALNTPSAGTALVYGAAAYDATDIAQAMTVAEDVTVTTNTGTATVQETVNGNDANNGVTLVVVIPPSTIDLVVDDAMQAQSTDGAALTQVHALAVADATQAQATDAVALTQTHLLTAADSTQAQAADQVTITVAPIDLVVADAAHGHSADSPALTQTHQLAVADATQSHAVDSVTVTVDPIALAVQDATHTQTATTPSLSQSHALAVADAAHTHTAGSPALTQAHSLSVADATHAQAVDSPSLTQVHVLAVDGATHAQAADTVTVTEVGPSDLVVADAIHAQSADNVTLTQVHTLTPAGANQGQTTDTLVLTQVHALVVADAHQAQLADAVALTQSHLLTVTDAVQGQQSDQVALTQTVNLTVADSAHAQAAENVTLELATVELVVQDARHAHLADSLTLSQAQSLVVAGAVHAQQADEVVLALAGEVRFDVSAAPRVAATDLVVPRVAAESHVIKRVLFDSQVEEVANVELDTSAT